MWDPNELSRHFHKLVRSRACGQSASTTLVDEHGGFNRTIYVQPHRWLDERVDRKWRLDTLQIVDSGAFSTDAIDRYRAAKIKIIDKDHAEWASLPHPWGWQSLAKLSARCENLVENSSGALFRTSSRPCWESTANQNLL